MALAAERKSEAEGGQLRIGGKNRAWLGLAKGLFTFSGKDPLVEENVPC